MQYEIEHSSYSPEEKARRYAMLEEYKRDLWAIKALDVGYLVANVTVGVAGILLSWNPLFSKRLVKTTGFSR